MTIKKRYLLPFLLLIFLQGCHPYLIDKESAAKQLTNLKIGKRHSLEFSYGQGSVGGNSSYSNGLNYFIIKNENHYDTIVPSDINIFLKSGINSGYANPHNLIFKEGYFIFFKDTTLKTHPKCKTCRINIDSVEKIIIRGSRVNKVKR